MFVLDPLSARIDVKPVGNDGITGVPEISLPQTANTNSLAEDNVPVSGPVSDVVLLRTGAGALSSDRGVTSTRDPFQ
jgi:hypothetical protein